MQLFFRGSVIESTTLPITLILEFCQLPIVIGNVIVSISFQLQITKLPISGACFGSGCGGRGVVDEVVGADGGEAAVHEVGALLFDWLLEVRRGDVLVHEEVVALPDVDVFGRECVQKNVGIHVGFELE